MNDGLNKCIDYDSHTIAMIDADHAMIHRGEFFTVYQTTTALGASSWVDFYFITDTDIETHLKQIDATNSGGLCEFLICEGGTTMTMGGTTCVSYNRNRNSTIVTSLSVNKNTTWGSTSGGITSTQTNVVSRFYIGSTGTAPTRLGGSESNSLEWILKNATTYVIRMNNLGTAGYASLRLHFYEE